MIRITIWLFLLSVTFYIAETKPTTNQRSDEKEKNELKDCKYGWNINTNACLKGKTLNTRLEKTIIYFKQALLLLEGEIQKVLVVAL